MLNKVMLIGNLGREPEIRHLESGTAVAKFPIATNESYKDKSGEWQTNTEWHDIVCWRQLAERAERDLKKGNLVFVEGKITKRKWQDKEGNDRYTTEVIAHTFRLLEKRESQNTGYTDNFPTSSDELPRTNDNTTSIAKDFSSTEGDDDLPRTNDNTTSIAKDFSSTEGDDDLPF